MRNKRNLFCLISVRRRKDDVLHVDDETGPLLGDTNHSNNGTDCKGKTFFKVFNNT